MLVNYGDSIQRAIQNRNHFNTSSALSRCEGIVEYHSNIVKVGKFAPDLTFDLDRVTTRMRFKTESLIFFFAFDDYNFRRLAFKPCILDLMHKKVYMITSEMESTSRATLDEVQTIFS